VAILSAAALRGWSGWLELRRLELERRRQGQAGRSATGLNGLRQRVKRLEAIASGVDS
jgi:hypothetical protein